jgi:hypothetical protein
MKHTKQELENMISRTGLSSRHQKALHELIGLRKHPLFLGYFVYAVGIACLILFFNSMYLMFAIAWHRQKLGLNPTYGIQGAEGLSFLLSLFLMSGAQTYINRIRASRAVVELLMKKESLEPCVGGDVETASPQR